jgi:hypothetical protein
MTVNMSVGKEMRVATIIGVKIALDTPEYFVKLTNQ